MAIQKRKRLKPGENRYKIDEAEHILVPGAKIFDNDWLCQWLRTDGTEVNIDILFHKFPRWYVNTGRNPAEIDLSKMFEIPKKHGGYKKDPHDYKREHLEDIVELSRTPPKNYARLKSRHFFDETYSFTLTTATRLLIGFAGSDTILENSLSLHPFYGFPVIPGSSLKGLTRHYCSEYEKPSEKITSELIKRIFGNTEATDAEEGEVVFMDAWPQEWPQGKPILNLDIMTPHYGAYYQKESNALPSDDKDPVPIPFLAVAKGVKFRFCLLPSSRCKDKNIVRTTICLLQDALKTFGAGAKTGSSYGYFK